MKTSQSKSGFIYLCFALLGGCGGGGGGDGGSTSAAAPTYSIGGTVSGLASGASVVLQNNGGNSLTVSASGGFSFTTALAANSAYVVTVSTQPAGQSCTVTNGGGTVASANVTTVSVSCALNPNSLSTLSSTHKPTLVGIVIDSAVANLNYSSLTQSGATNTSGQFNYQPGEIMTFKVGGVALPPVVGASVVLVANFGSSADLMIRNRTIFNVAWFLQSLDSDGNVANGITIAAPAHTALQTNTLDFTQDSASFYTVANPMIAAVHSAGGTSNTGLIDSAQVGPNIIAGLATVPKISPIAGTWITGTGGTLQGVTFLDNHTYYLLTASCAGGNPNYEFGTWAYNTTTNQLTTTATDNHDGSCGLNNATVTATITGTSLSLNSLTWQLLSPTGATTTLSAPYANSNLADPTKARIFFFTANEYLLLEGGAAPHIESGTYTWNASTHVIAATVVHATDATSIVSHETLATTDGSLLTLGTATSSDDSDISTYAPGVVGASLLGGWDYGDPQNGGAYAFTADGKIVISANCTGLLTASRESGSYVWDTSNGNASVTIAQDGNGTCGEANLAAGINSTITNLVVSGNILDITTSSGKKSIPRILSSLDFRGAWQSTTNPSLIVGIDNNADVTTSNQFIFAIGSDCAISTDDEVSNFVLAGSAVSGVLPAGNSGDIVGCGLPATFGPNFSVTGDTLNIQGFGVFTRVR